MNEQRHAKAEYPENGLEISRLRTDNSLLKEQLETARKALVYCEIEYITVTKGWFEGNQERIQHAEQDRLDAELFRKLEFLAHNGPVSEWDQIYRSARHGKFKETVDALISPKV